MPKGSSAKTVLARKPVFWILLSLFPLLAVALYPAASSGIECARYQSQKPYSQDMTLHIAGRTIAAEVASTPDARARGLGGRVCMRPDQGMLFMFDRDDISDHCFWMKDMRFPLDILWLDNDKRVVFSASKVSPATYPQLYCPNRPTRYVLELVAGSASQLGLRYDSVVPL